LNNNPMLSLLLAFGVHSDASTYVTFAAHEFLMALM